MSLTIQRLDQPIHIGGGEERHGPQQWVLTATRPDGTTLRVVVTTEQGATRDIIVQGIRPEEIQ